MQDKDLEMTWWEAAVTLMAMAVIMAAAWGVVRTRDLYRWCAKRPQRRPRRRHRAF